MSLEFTPDEPVFIKAEKIDDSVVAFKIYFGKKLIQHMMVSDSKILMIHQILLISY